MPFYFFHLKLELYQAPAISKRRQLTSHSKITPYLPPEGTDIFTAALPAHRTSKWASYSFSKRPDPPNTASPSSSTSETHPPRLPPSDFTESHGDTLLLPERSLKGTARPTSTSPAPKPGKPSNEAAARDWRYDTVQIEGMDMEAQRNGLDGTTKGSAVAGGLHTKAVYLPSEPKTTEVGWGVVHLYRDNEESSVLADDSRPGKSADAATNGLAEDSFSIENCTTLCILAVPSWMMPSDLLGFVGEQARDDVSHFRLIRTGRANKYMVLMKFRSPKKARDWQKAYNGRLFSAAEPENCHVVFIRSVEFLSPDSSDVGDTTGSFPRNNQHDPFLSSHADGDAASRVGKTLSSKPLAPPPPNLLELPTCPVCLERMDETTGLLTILCQHVFHCACLEKWRFPGSGCPVCRYTQSPSYTFPYPRPHDGEEESEPLCSVCATDLNLWICLICGNIGCGRYDSAHAYAHYEATSHCYAMDISTQHVWDYAGDGYVHRLIQSKPFASDGSNSGGGGGGGGGVVDMPAGRGERRDRHENEAFRAEGGETVPREKMESMAIEYTYLLTSQLEGQRRYFEEQIERAADKAAEASARADEAAQQAQKASASAEQARSDHSALRSALTRAETAVDKSERARAKFEQMARSLTAQLRDEKTMAEGLLARVHAADDATATARRDLETARAETADLRELNRDLSMFISGQEKVRELQARGEEVVDGHASVPAPVVPETTGKGKGKGKGKKK